MRSMLKKKPGKSNRGGARPGAGRKPGQFNPVFDTLAQCAAGTGVPMTALRMAKANGCRAFRHGRVDFMEFVRWWFGAKVDATDWSKELKKEQTLWERIKRKEKEKEVIDFSTVRRFLQDLIGNDVFGQLERMAQEWPPAQEGLNKADIYAAIIGDIEQMKAVLMAKWAPWKKARV